jgi:precorrin-6B C5,15-methyltransferase / cobalt-precorrin-6B C5,C15-methyltransferase
MVNEPIKIIGISDNGKAGLLPIYQQWISESERLVGGERHLAFFSDYVGEKLAIKGGLSRIVERLQNETKKTVVLASGDPLFYGIGSYLAKKMNVEIYPQATSIQAAFSRIQETWQDAYLVSLHGKSIQGLAQRIDGKDKVALLTDADNNPAEIAKYLLSFGMREYRAFVAENLDGDLEKAGWYELSDMAAQTFSPLNVVILKRQGQSPQWTMGIPDEQFSQRKPDKGLITKREVRVLSLANLNLRPNSIVWDIGTCTGSVAIEAARIAREGAVFAVEKSEGDLQNCRENMRKFRTDFTAILGKAPDGLESFPDPDAVFIGGTGGNLQQLLSICCKRLRVNGRIVLNAATIETMQQALQVFSEEGYTANITQAQISRSKPILAMTRFEALNPVFIITAERRGET